MRARRTIFIAEARRTGNLSAAARAAGFSLNAVLDRRRNKPAFAARIEAALEDAEIVLEFRLASLGGDVAVEEAEGEGAGMGTGTSSCPRFDPHFALSFLKWREQKRAGGGERGRPGRNIPPEPDVDAVRANILRKLDAIEAHEKKKGDSHVQRGGGGSDAAAGDSDRPLAAGGRGMGQSLSARRCSIGHGGG